MPTKSDVLSYLHTSTVPDRLKDHFFAQLPPPTEDHQDPRITCSPDIVFITGEVNTGLLKDIIALKECNPGLVCLVLTNMSSYYCQQQLSADFVDEEIVFSDALHLGQLLLTLPKAVPVVMYARTPEIVFVAYSFPALFFFYRPWGFIRTLRLSRCSRRKFVAHISGYAELYMMNNSVATYHTEGELTTQILKKEFGICRPLVTIYPGCQEHFFQGISVKTGEQHLVNISNVPHKHILPHVAKLTSQLLHVHVYPPHYYYKEGHVLYISDLRPGLEAMLGEQKRNGYFHIHEDKPHQQIIEEMAQYGFLLPYFEFYSRSWYAPVTTGFFAGLEAGLPLIVPKSSRGMAEIVTREGVGLAVTKWELPRLAKEIAALDKEQLAINIDLARCGSLRFNSRGLYNLLFGERSLSTAQSR